MLKTVNTILLESSRMEAWVNMELLTHTLELVATIGSGSKTTSTQIQESVQRAVNHAMTLISALMEAKSSISMGIAAASID